MKTTTNPGKKLTKIDAQFIEELEKLYGSMLWNFEVEEKQIVPTELTHDELMLNNRIDEKIYKYYFMPTSKMLTDAEFQEMVNGGHSGKRETFLTPYPFSINGAYHSRTDLVTKLSRLNCTDEKPYLNGNNNLENFEDLTPYFKEYAEGFENGYNEFEDKCIKPFLPMFPDKQDFITKVFEYLTDRRFFHRDWLNNHINGFVVYHHNGPEGGNIENGFENGQKQGYFYKAWGIVFSNNALFAPLFQNHKSTSSPQREESKLSLNQIALIHCYKNEPITRDNGKEIAASHGYTAKTSGDKLYQNFNKYYNATNRKGDEGTKKKNQNKIELIESIIPLLPTDKQSKAIDEVSILKNIQETEYS